MAAQLTRRNFGKSVAAAGLILAVGAAPRTLRAEGAKYRLRYATAFPADHPGVTQIQEAATAIAKDTGGLVDLQVFPNSQLGSEPDMFSQVRAGALDMMSTSGVNQTVVPVGGINAIAFAFPSYDKVWAAMDGELGNHVRAKFEKVGLFVMPKMLDNGYRHITSSAKPVTSPDDLRGFKIRVPGNQLWVTTFKALGAAPTPINFGELYAALQTHVVDGQENPLALINSAKLYEVQKYVAVTGHIWDGHYIFVNLARWNGLPEDVQQKLATRYGDLFAVFWKHRDVVNRVTLWGATDKTSWLNNWPVRGRISYPLLFDREGKPKPAFYAVLKAAQK